jgi:hypothetical protein
VVIAAALSGVGANDTVRAADDRVPELKIAKLQQAFNTARKETRVFVLLSPTSVKCQRGAAAVEAMLKRHPDANVHVFLVWEPVAEKDRKGDREAAYLKATDPRLVQFWDSKLELSNRIVTEAQDRPELLRGVENVRKNMVIVDAVAVFVPRVRWQGNLPVPDYYGRSVVDRIADVESLVAAGK